MVDMDTDISVERLDKLINQHREAAILHTVTADTLELMKKEKLKRAKTTTDSRVWTEARIEMLKAEWSGPASTTELWKKLNKLPGVHISSPRAISSKAERLGIRRHTTIIRPKGMTKEDRDEGDRYIEQGWDALKLADWFGCTTNAADLWIKTYKNKRSKHD